MSALRAGRFVFPRLLWSRRAQLVALLLAWPLLLPLLAWLSGAGLPSRTTVFEGYLDTILPLAALVHATRLIRDDVESRTITYLLSRPISRPALLWGEMGAFLVAMLAVCLPATIVGWLLLADDGGSGSLPGVVAAAVLAVAAFGALFTLLGLVLRRPLTLGLVFLFGWERLAGAPGLLPRLTLSGYVRALAGMSSRPAGLDALPAALVMIAVLVACALLGAAVFTTREYVPEP
jgi:ABC-2 type transport system permease protein